MRGARPVCSPGTGERQANAAELLRSVEHRTSRQVRRLLAERFGPTIASVRAAGGLAPGTNGTATVATTTGAADLPVLKRVLAPLPAPYPASAAAPLPRPTREASAADPPARRARLTPVAPGRFELVAILGEEACAQLEASRELLGYRGADLERALAYCASRAEAPLEARLRHALGCLAPRARKESPASNEAA